MEDEGEGIAHRCIQTSEIRDLHTNSQALVLPHTFHTAAKNSQNLGEGGKGAKDSPKGPSLHLAWYMPNEHHHSDCKVWRKTKKIEVKVRLGIRLMPLLVPNGRFCTRKEDFIGKREVLQQLKCIQEKSKIFSFRLDDKGPREQKRKNREG